MRYLILRENIFGDDCVLFYLVKVIELNDGSTIQAKIVTTVTATVTTTNWP